MQKEIIFDNYWALMLIPVLIAFIIIVGRNLHFRSTLRKRITMAIRIMLVLCLSIALAAPSITTRLNRTGTIFIADVSDSTKASGGNMQDFIDQALHFAQRKDITGVVAFANDATVVKMPDNENTSFSLDTRLRSNDTNIQRALTLSQSIMPENVAKRLVLLSDGKQTSGNAIETATLLNRLGYTVDVARVGTVTGKEVQIEEFTSPKQVNAKEVFDISVKIKSNVDTKAIIRLYENRALAQEKVVELYEGDNLFTFTDTAQQSGMITYTAEIVTDDDTVLQNNQLSSFVQVQDRPRILVVERGNNGENFVRFVEEYAQVTRVSPQEVPVSMQEIIKYDAYILVDISYEWLDEEFLVLLEQAIKHQGKGLLAIGGENSYAPGGYNGTPLETVLPVNMDISQKEENPDLGLLLVIDKSGSMTSGAYGISKIELAKEAAIRAVEVLEDTDQLGVIAFDSAIQWVIRTEQLSDKQKAMDMIGSIRAGGGTQILHPLEAAWQDLRKKDTKLKHIILLTDGQAEQYGYEKVLEGLNQDGITLSTVAVGQGADTLLLRALAYGGMGRYYQTDEFSDIPSIFAKEAFLAGQKYIQNRHFYPELVNSMGLLRGIEALPPLDGYVATKIKPAARTVLRSDTEDPILAVWQYGLGRTAAWTSDIQGFWTSQWSMWQNAPLFWGNLTGYLVQKNINDDYSINTELRDGDGIITLSANLDDLPQVDTIEGVVVSPEGILSDIELRAIKPGVYEGGIGKKDSGAYIVNIKVPGEGTNVSTGIVMPYAGEYRLLSDSDNFLEKLATAGGGRVVTSPEEVFGGDVQDAGGKRDITNFFIILSLILLLLDIAFRKLKISFEPFIKFFDDRIIPAKEVFIEKMTNRKKQISNQADNTLNTGNIRDIDNRHNEVEEFEGEQEPTSKAAGVVSANDDLLKTKGKDTKEKDKKDPGESPRDLEQQSDHVNALLNRRKKWK